jgi:protein-tyrosine phosphatase
MISVLFVCMGNICRSPMAEGVFRDLVVKAGLGDQFVIDSVGMGAWHVGEPAHRGTLAVLKAHGITYDGRSRQIHRDDLKTFQCILLADRETQSAFRRFGSVEGAKVDLMLGAAHRAGLLKTDEVPDPYYVGNFEAVYDLVLVGCKALLEEIINEHGLSKST